MAATSTALSGAITARSSQIRLASYTAPVTGFGVPILLLVGQTEQMRVISHLGAVLTVLRGYNGTTALAHADGATVSYGIPSDISGPSTVQSDAGPQAIADSDSVEWDFGDGVASAAASGSGGSILHQATVTLTNAQIKALPSSAVQLVAAQGANTLVLLVTASLVVDASGGTYTNIDPVPDGVIVFGIGTAGDSTALDAGYVAANGILDAPSDRYPAFSVVSSAAALEGNASFFSNATSYVSTIPATNLPLVIAAYNGGDYTGGDASNSARVSVAYLVLNISTGAFV